MDTSVRRFDFAPITRSETTPEGFLRVWCKAARTGTQLYRRADGSQVREYRPPEEVGNPEALATFGMTPVTYEHPPALLDSDNTKKFQIGYSGSQVRYNDGFVEVALVVTDKDAIERIQKGDAREVSAGYKVDFDPTPGITPEGESYDGIQRNIRVNHIAVVPRGRAGPEVRLLLDRMDAADAVAEPSGDPQPKSPTSLVMATIHLDGLEMELPAEAASAVQSHVRELNRQITALTSERDDFSAKLDALTEEFSALSEEKEMAEGRADALEERLSELDGADGARIDTAELDRLVSARLATLQTLAPAFAEDFKFDGIDEDTLYSEAFKNLTGSAPREDADPAYIQGVVEGILAARADAEPEDEEGDDPEDDSDEGAEGVNQDAADSTLPLRRALQGARADSSDPVISYRARQEEAWKRPLTATKGA